jgi:hypothetical protein
MHTSARSAFLHCSETTSVTSRTAVYGPVRTVVWQGSAGDCRPYADQVAFLGNFPRRGPVWQASYRQSRFTGTSHQR